MILKALYDYYDRCGNLPAPGTELKEIAFLIVIDKDGNFIRLEDRRIDAKTAQKFLVPQGVGRSSAPIPNLLWDNPAYVLGISDANFPFNQSKLTSEKIEKKEKEREKERAKNIKCHATFIEMIETLHHQHPDWNDVKALCQFYQQSDIIQKIEADPLWIELKKNLTKNISFIIEGCRKILPEREGLVASTSKGKGVQEGLCLITGERSELAETTTATAIPGSQASAKLVSFQVHSGYDSYGKQKGYNAPISKKAEFKYTTALKTLLSKDSRNKFLVGSRTFVFWTSTNTEVTKEIENSIFQLFGFEPTTDDPNKNIENVRKVLMSIYSGTLKTSLNDIFYILGLAPNSARIAVSYWSEQPLKQFAGMILRHFNDMEIVDTRKEKRPYMGLRSMLSAVTQGGKSSEASPNLPDVVVKSIFQGYPYPYTLFASCIRRINAEKKISITRAAILKAFLNRLNDNHKKIKVMLDTENSNQGYLCGRLFAVLDKIQADANGTRSIKERYLNAASSTPASVFATILNLSSHHSENLSEGSRIFYEKIKQEIVDKISSNGFPSHLDLQDQGRFFVGYYQQMQWFFTAKENK